MNKDEISASVSNKEQKNNVGVHDEDEVEHAEERVSVTRSEVLNAINTLRRAVEEHDIGPYYFVTLNNLEHIMMVSIQKNRDTSHITDFFEKT